MHCANPDITLILPAYNEAQTICTSLADATGYFRRHGWTYQIIVSADGNDGTRERAREYSQSDAAVQVIGTPERRGKGRGVREGVKIATGKIIGFADADNKVPITELDTVEPWLHKGYEMVIGSRGLERSQVERQQPWYRRIGSRGFYYCMHAVVGMPGIEDTQCGFKFFHRVVAQELFSRQRIDGYMFDVEILALAQRLAYRIKEVPVRWRDDADSRLQLLAGNLQNGVDLFKIRYYCAKQTNVFAAARARANNG